MKEEITGEYFLMLTDKNLESFGVAGTYNLLFIVMFGYIIPIFTTGGPRLGILKAIQGLLRHGLDKRTQVPALFRSGKQSILENRNGRIHVAAAFKSNLGSFDANGDVIKNVKLCIRYAGNGG